MLGSNVRRWHEKRDWAEWDLEHPYIPVGRPEHALHPSTAATNEEHQGSIDKLINEKVAAAGFAPDVTGKTVEPEDAKAVVATTVATGMFEKYGTQFDGQLLTSGYVSTSTGMPPSIDMMDENHTVMKMDSGSVVIGTLNHGTASGDALTEAGYIPAVKNEYGETTKPAVAVGNTPEAMAMVREAGVAGMVHQWAVSSNDTDPKSLAIQVSAVKEFGLTDTAPWIESSSDPNAQSDQEHFVGEELEKNGAMYQAFLRSQYDATQKALSDAGITEVTVHRGTETTTDDEKAFAASHEAGTAQVDITSRPLSSWSTSRDTAVSFAPPDQSQYGGDAGGVIYDAVVPADRILSTPVTGNGCLSEHEVVVLGGKDTVTISRGSDADVEAVSAEESAAKEAGLTNAQYQDMQNSGMSLEQYLDVKADAGVHIGKK